MRYETELLEPNFWNRIFHYKRWKPLYFVRGFWRYYVTAGWAKRRLNALLAEALQRPDWDYIRSRVEYYNRLPQLAATPETEAIRKVAEAIAATKTDPATYMLVNRYIDTLKEMAMGNDSKLVYLPYESSNLMSALGALTNLTKK